MNTRCTILAGALALAPFAQARAEEFKPIQAQAIDLGAVSGVAYYTVERDGFRVVATLAQGEDATPVRFEALLVPGTSVTISTPRGAGAAPEAVEISRQAEALLVRKAAAAATN